MKTIVIYYGYGNHTRMIAERVKKELNADILEIKPKVAYSPDYQTVVDATENNLETKETPEIEVINIDLNNYDKIVIGTPVWWYTMTPPIRTFLTKYDLRNKKVYPFATNAGWLGSTFEEFKELCNGNILFPISIKFSMNHAEDNILTSDTDINNWINNIKKD